jgi:hypothetical protein
MLDDCLICFARDYARDFFDGIATLSVGAAAAAGAAAGTVAGTASRAAGAAQGSYDSAYEHQQAHDADDPDAPSPAAHADPEGGPQGSRDGGVRSSFWPDPGDWSREAHPEAWVGIPNETTPRYFGGVRQED